MITRQELIQKYIDFFKKKKHVQIPSASLIPENDPTVLFTTAGMHPLVPYLLGQKHPSGKSLVSVQKCVRTGDIEEVGDTTHHTFFEMLGNWSLGDYGKKEAIEYSFEFLTKILKIPSDKLAVTCFAGDVNAPRDEESAKVWLSLGIPKERITYLPKENNWWGPAGATGPCGPDTEMFYYHGSKAPKVFDPEDKAWVEIWNDVFMEYEKNSKGEYVKAKQKNVDTGMGVERTLAALNGFTDNYKTTSFAPLIEQLEELSGRPYKENTKSMRVVADHIRTAVFMLGDEKPIVPSNIGRGYVLRRLIRRAVRFAKQLGITQKHLSALVDAVIMMFPDYQELKKNRKIIVEELDKEEERFARTLEQGLLAFKKITESLKVGSTLTGTDTFLLFQSYGFPLEMTEELAQEKKLKVDKKGFGVEQQKHQGQSKSTSVGAFKSGLADNSEQTTRLHTATHLLNEALREVLGKDVKQKGSNITPERLRFDFNFARKLTEKEIKEIEALVNAKINAHLSVIRTEMNFEEAIKQGAQAEFGHKYPERVSVYTIEDAKEEEGWFSKEICTGPHVKNTKEIGAFKIIKEESAASGIRRIKASVA